MKTICSRILVASMLLLCNAFCFAQEATDSTKVTTPATEPEEEPNVVDEVIWVVGDEPILKSEVEALRQEEGVHWKGNPDCSIPEQIAIQKLYLNQAVIDSIEVTDAEVATDVENQLNYWIQMAGSREKLEEYRKMTIQQMRDELRSELRNRRITEQMQRELIKDVAVTPSEVRKFFKDLPEDSIPFVPTQVEVQIITHTPRIDPEEINKVKNDLREYTERITKGETSFATLARLYSEDPGSARMGGEMDYVGRGLLDQSFAAVAFNLTDPKKISKIVESEFGFHIIQLIDKRGDKIKVRHILRKPVVSDAALDSMCMRLDTLAMDIRAGKTDFEEAATFISDDKDTKSNKGNMFNTDMQTGMRTSRFEMQDLPPEIAKVVDTLEVGQISAPFVMINSKNKKTCVIAKLKNRIPRHRATMTEDYQILQDVVLAKRREEVLHKWIQNKIKSTYVRINPKYRDCDFEYTGWVK
ncbi:MAG: peptidylprolyl isomerase [Prevotellaceae bacterium]|nr:peptidylprolyl isomerase [Prevotellaceae bacterium]